MILPTMVSMKRGRSFPSTMTDDPVLGIVMPGGDSYPFGEERRLALTRARRTVVMFTVLNKVSRFLKELLQDGAVQIEDVNGTPVRINPCPKCMIGDVIVQSGKHGEFEKCNNFPDCDYKPPKKAATKKTKKFSNRRFSKRTFRV